MLVAFATAGSLTGLYIIGDTAQTCIDIMGCIMSGNVKLMATYYIVDLNYPKAHAMVLAMLQTCHGGGLQARVSEVFQSSFEGTR
jgi:hypothetical protein